VCRTCSPIRRRVDLSPGIPLALSRCLRREHGSSSVLSAAASSPAAPKIPKRICRNPSLGQRVVCWLCAHAVGPLISTNRKICSTHRRHHRPIALNAIEMVQEGSDPTSRPGLPEGPTERSFVMPVAHCAQGLIPLGDSGVRAPASRLILNAAKGMFMKWTLTVAGLIMVCTVSALAQRLDVKIIDRQDKEDSYDYAAVYNNVAVGKTFKVHGATYTLQLPDGRLAIVNCESKFAEHMAGHAGNRRSCRTPLIDSIQADFKSDKAKLIWPVSLDGKKMQSETYKILGILDKPKSD
jgi:hypothetical protein